MFLLDDAALLVPAMSTLRVVETGRGYGRWVRPGEGDGGTGRPWLDRAEASLVGNRNDASAPAKHNGRVQEVLEACDGDP